VILVHLTFRIDPNWKEVDASSRILTEYHFYINDDKSHDNLFVQHCFKLHWKFLGHQGFLLLVEHIVFSNGYASQFKCVISHFFVARYPSLTKSEELPIEGQCNGTILVEVMVKGIGMVQEPM
jgi:hypothetical protein